jgi:uncharacterized protein
MGVSSLKSSFAFVLRILHFNASGRVSQSRNGKSMSINCDSKKVELDPWEARCLRCGRCCYEKIDFEGRIYYTNRPCDKLDLQTRLCTVYVHRDQEKPGCSRLNEDILRMGVLPADCPYVADVTDYDAPTLWEQDDGE